ncbi:hypothetical protein CIG19_11195 [Enterobacterales bacterium CwR94]|nr:hypothetical protein CIG19_11195 [Enterobacterales bacterium CwR94]
MLFSASSAFAAETQLPLIERLLHCQASPRDIAEMNSLVDNDSVSLQPNTELSIWGGKAWHLPQEIAINGEGSTTFVMNSRAEFYLLYLSNKPREDLSAIAQELKLKMVLDSQGYVDYQRAEGIGVVRAVSADSADENYYLGCAYNI